MHPALVIAGVVLLPGLWGCLVAVVFERLFPPTTRQQPKAAPDGADSFPHNFQI
ncbi:MAG TPA: hypothetical protein VM452_08150 [Caulifigura sp.]|nr:hypothetical protein [Caulifigura sp.]